MKKTRYTEEQIAFALKQAETGIRSVSRQITVNAATFIQPVSGYPVNGCPGMGFITAGC